MKYFIKHLVFNPVLGPDGKPISWEALQGEDGIKEVDETRDPVLADKLSEFSQKQQYGVVEVGHAEYEQKKKSTPAYQSAPRSDLLQAWQQPGRKSEAPANAAAVSPPPVASPSPFFNEGTRVQAGLPPLAGPPPAPASLTPPPPPVGMQVVQPAQPPAALDANGKPADAAPVSPRSKLRMGKPRPRQPAAPAEAAPA
jgi:hypothetical protein